MKSIEMILLCMILFASCNNGPKVLESQGGSSDNSASSTGIFSDASDNSATTQTDAGFKDQVHTVVAEEVLPTDKYVYVRVKENETEEFWVATRKMNIEVGASYFFRGGLLKTQFESKEYNRIFDRVYLVSNLVPTDHSSTQNSADNSGEDTPVADTGSIELKEGSISISELVNNKEDYASKSVQLTGMVVKVNPNIMNRNWIHLKDGSMDDYDMVITSSVAIPEGHVVSLKGTVKLDSDFGAGYTYELLVENAELVR